MLKRLKQKLVELPDIYDGFVASRPWDKYTVWIFIVIGILAVVCNIYAVWHLPIGMADESWIYYVLHEQVETKATFYPLYYKAFRGWSILSLRYLALGLMLSVTGVLALSVYSLFRDSFSKRGLVSFMFCGIFWYAILFPQSVSVPSYITLEFLWGELAVAALFFAFSAKSSLWQRVALLASGFCSTQLFLDMFPAAPMVLLVFLAACCVGVKGACFWIIGVLVGFGFYFVLLQSPVDFLHQTIAAFTTSSKNQHDKMLLVRWSAQTAFYFVTRILGYCIAACALVEIPSEKKIEKFYFGLVFALGVAFVAAVEMIQSAFASERTFSIGVLYIMFALAVMMYARERRLETRKAVALVLASLAPILLCLGTNVDFSVRSLFYAMMLAFPVLMASKVIRNRHLAFYVFLLVALFAVRFFMQFNATSWATWEKYFTPSHSLSEYGTNVTASATQLRNIKNIEEKTRGSAYLVGNTFCWQYIVVLNKKPVRQAFYQSSSDLRPDFSKSNLTKYDVAFVVNRKDPEKDYFPGWIELYREYFDAKTIEHIELNRTEEILLFR